MYDARSEAKEFVAESEKEAVAKAAEFFELDAAELTVKVPDQQEIYGLSSRVVVVAFPQSAPAPSRSGGEREERSERSDRGGRDRDRGGRDGRRGGGRERGGRGERSERSDRPDRPDRGERGARGGRGERESAPRREEAPAAEEAIADSKGKPVGDLGEVGQFLLGTIERMQVGSFELEENAEDDFLVLEIRGAAAEALGSGDGRGIDALQLLANQVSMRLSDDAPRIVVDAEGNSEKREAFLSRLAERAARRAEDSSRSVALDPMNAHDRRLVHVALRDMDGIATMSIGSGRYRQVVVVPEGSPEYDDARRSSEEAATRERD